MARARRMTEGSIARHLLAYALPLILGNLFQLTYNAVDTIIIGKFAGERALAAVSAADPVMTIVILGVSGISIGASVLMSRFYGAGQEDMLRREAATTILFGAAASLAVFVPGLILAGPILRLLRVPGEILGLATVYLRIVFVGFLFTFQYNILAAMLRSVGDSRTPVIFLEI
ncbi:MAG: MATE family efflux transporter, partial [Candidatus Ventricola sp.]